MAKDGLLIFVCAATLLAGSLSGFAAPPDDTALADTLAVHSAMQQAREYLLGSHPREAVNVLHRGLGHINGNPAYLALLRDAYQAAIKELQLAHQEAEAQRYVKWLAILEPGTARERGPLRSTPKPTSASLPGKKPEKEIRAASAEPPAPKPTVVRASIDENPFNDGRADQQKIARDFLHRAEQEFGQRKFAEAGRLYDQAHQADSKITEASCERWAYCKLFRVVEILNHQGSGVRGQESGVRSQESGVRNQESSQGLPL